MSAREDEIDIERCENGLNDLEDQSDLPSYRGSFRELIKDQDLA